MRIDPQLRALQGNPALQRTIQDTLEAIRDEWLAGPAADVMADLAAYGDGTSLDHCKSLRALFDDADATHALINRLVSPLLGALKSNPLGQIPLRQQSNANLSILELARRGRAALTLITYDALDIEPDTVSFGDGERHELVLAGAADVLRVDVLEEGEARAALDTTVRRLVPGETFHCRDSEQTRVIRKVHGRFVLLRLARTQEDALDTRQFALSDGRLVHRASGRRDESRQEMAMALLGRMGRTEAAPVFSALSREGSAHIRWQALRECLALDSAQGFAALSRIAADPHDALAVPAGALRAQLLESYPQLQTMEAARCPA